MTAQERWAMPHPGWCRAGQKFAKQHSALSSAWRACSDGRFMAFWLTFCLGDDQSETLWTDIQMLRPQGMTNTLIGGTPAQRRAFATKIRANFNSDGTHRKRRTR